MKINKLYLNPIDVVIGDESVAHEGRGVTFTFTRDAGPLLVDGVCNCADSSAGLGRLLSRFNGLALLREVKILQKNTNNSKCYTNNSF